MRVYFSINRYHHVLDHSMCFDQFFSGAQSQTEDLNKIKTGLLVILFTFVEQNIVDVFSVPFPCKSFPNIHFFIEFSI